jgi:hypothetical protein
MPETIDDTPLRLLYLPNEANEGDQFGPRAAFEAMLADQTLSDYLSFSFLIEARKPGGADEAMRRLVQMAADFQPDVVFWQHISRFPLRSMTLKSLQALRSGPLIVYHEGDIFGRLSKRPTSSMHILAAHSDVVFVVGLGENADLFRRMGARCVMYAPHSVDEVRFGKPWNARETNRSGVVMIGNRLTSRIRPLRFPGAIAREKLAVRLHRLLGDRFSVYGRGWEGFGFSRGPLPFHEQERVLRQHCLSVAWSHDDTTPYYFSDRLPIALLSGVAHATNYQPGYELMFCNGQDLAYYRDVDEAVDMVDWLLSRPPSYLIEMGLAGERLARRWLTSDQVFREMVSIIHSLRHTTSLCKIS